jgi:hypothetical protein
MKNSEKIALRASIIAVIIFAIILSITLHYENNREMPEGYTLLIKDGKYSFKDDDGWFFNTATKSKRRAIMGAWFVYEEQNDKAIGWEEVK